MDLYHQKKKKEFNGPLSGSMKYWQGYSQAGLCRFWVTIIDITPSWANFKL